MKRTLIITTILGALVFTSCGYKGKTSVPSSNPGNGQLPSNVKLISTTPIKDQGESELCWAYGMLGTIESEHIMKGDSINLSIAYIARMMLQEKAVEYYL